MGLVNEWVRSTVRLVTSPQGALLTVVLPVAVVLHAGGPLRTAAVSEESSCAAGSVGGWRCESHGRNAVTHLLVKLKGTVAGPCGSIERPDARETPWMTSIVHSLNN